MTQNDTLREQIAKLLEWQDAHATFDAAVEGLPPELRGATVEGAPYSAWQLLEHIRIAQADILEFTVSSEYGEKRWPDDYWPDAPEPPSPEAWDRSIEAYHVDRRALQYLARKPEIDLFAPIPHGEGQTYLRELLLVADHTAYHVGEMILLRRLLGAWR
jgi:uncharacterized damage-inducible protein DinB